MMRLEDIDHSLYVEDDVNGIVTYYLDPELTKPYTGVIYNKWRGKIESEAEFIDGLKNGLEYIYNEDEEVIQINECRGNVIFGVVKEYEKESLKSVSIVYNNSFLKILNVNLEDFNVLRHYDNQYGNELPHYLKSLLQLSNKQLIEYEFKKDNPYLRPPYNI
ncbi:hypothetical protein [Myroides sp. DF42-4-2]|uniref:hypothetical protein n=1 Tax=Myroides sp. DF42-4-2 TaxID=2746726 RepID=UPI002575F0D0|nr:hypothetical protein [Myroides sp. DF42-4-2]MDM1409110.1 hypothetical protein [Myroides sp. DF42-4-2]